MENANGADRRVRDLLHSNNAILQYIENARMRDPQFETNVWIGLVGRNLLTISSMEREVTFYGRPTAGPSRRRRPRTSPSGRGRGNPQHQPGWVLHRRPPTPVVSQVIYIYTTGNVFCHPFLANLRPSHVEVYTIPIPLAPPFTRTVTYDQNATPYAQAAAMPDAPLDIGTSGCSSSMWSNGQPVTNGSPGDGESINPA